ncbi:flagellar filament capping protein FliD [Legionella spiritensis]|uniref:Flagellar hook-associated protein 2 n=1 Tax=Legionella spiritensis TaxID=452 RepID=A0A0W0Z4T7_LEGSP|nr:flagellar filament capping protein FliD [Legionella spiritensis]KTD64130.1 flagellar hook associated protein 2 FliD [Legionella spiritensis]SNV37990.1 flagellar hook-associated protein 2 [Legionella spiritensis]
MPGISSPGVGSGLDIQSIVDALVTAETAPAKNRLDRLESSISTELSAIGLVNSALAKLQSAMEKLTDINKFYTYKATVSDPNAFSATAGEGASAGNYQIDVRQLATKQNLASNAFGSSSDTVGQGSITIDFGSYNGDFSVFTQNPDKESVTINIGPGQDSLLAIRDAINNSDSGVQASIVQDSQGARLTLSSPETGKNFAMKITVDDNDANDSDSAGLSALAYDPTGGINNLQQTVAASDSEIKINGLTLTESGNQYKNAIEGVTIDLKKADPDTIVNLSIENNQAQLTGQINDFIKQYNDTMATLNSLTGYNKDTKQGGILQSDSGIRNLKFSLSQLISQPASDSASPLKSLADIGIKTNSQGLLTLDNDKLTKAIDEHYNDIGALFAKTATASDSNVRINTVGSDVKAGTYSLVVDSFIPGDTLTGSIGGIIATSTDGLTLKGSGEFKNLSVDILGGGTGARGNIVVRDGLATRFNDILTSYLGDQGELTARSKSLNEQITDVSEQRLQLQSRSESLERRFSNQFTKLDALLASMQTISEFLTTQLSSLQNYNRQS